MAVEYKTWFHSSQ